MPQPAAAELLQALDLLRDLDASGKRTLPEHVPTGFVKLRWRPYVFPSSGVDRHFYERCALGELRDRLRAGDIWVTGSRQYRDFETYLIPAATFKAIQKEPLPLDVDTQLPSSLTECRQRLEDNLSTVASKAREKTLPDVTLADGKLRITPLRKNTPESAEVFAEKADAFDASRQDYRTARPRSISGRVWVISSCISAPRRRPRIGRLSSLRYWPMGINLGLTRRSEACHATTWRQLWLDGRLACARGVLCAGPCRPDRCAASPAPGGALGQRHHVIFGRSVLSRWRSWRSQGTGETCTTVRTQASSSTLIYLISLGPFHTKVIAATANEAPHVLDGLLYHQSSLVIDEHYTDTGGFSDHVFARCRLLGFRFAPRIRALKEKRLYLLPGMTVPPEFASLVAGAINVRAISDQWFELLRLALSIKTGTVTASVILRKLAAYPRQNSLALALRELGKLERTFFTLQWLQDPELRRRSHVGLNKGAQQNALRRAVFLQPARRNPRPLL